MTIILVICQNFIYNIGETVQHFLSAINICLTTIIYSLPINKAKITDFKHFEYFIYFQFLQPILFIIIIFLYKHLKF